MRSPDGVTRSPQTKQWQERRAYFFCLRLPFLGRFLTLPRQKAFWALWPWCPTWVWSRMNSQVPSRRASCRSSRPATAVSTAQSLDQPLRAKKRVGWLRWRASARAASAAAEQDKGPTRPTQAAMKRTNRARVEVARRAGRRNVLILGSASAQITAGLLAGWLRAMAVLTITLPGHRATWEESLSEGMTWTHKGSPQLQKA